MPVYDTTVQSVTSRVVTKKDGKSTTIYEIVDSDGTKWATFKNTIANEANRLVGQAVQIQGRVEQNGQWENFYIDDIRMGTGAQNRALESVREAQTVQLQPHPSGPVYDATPQIPQIKRQEDQGPTEKDWSIARAVAVKVSAQLSEDPKSFWANLDALVTYLMLGLKPPEFENAHPTQESNQFIPETAYVDPGRDSPFPDTDSDIPF